MPKGQHTIHVVIPRDRYDVLKAECERVGTNPTAYARQNLIKEISLIETGSESPQISEDDCYGRSARRQRMNKK
ncbi:hypothetical protein GTO27_04185 [Candidatus Bathyarchaeota archaeon]|nr:hypothetical protein [Candidatus Bathyarchaeota archaeon]